MALILISDTTPRVAYTATAAQDTFTVPFPFFANADLTVYVDDVVQTLTTDYTVTGAGESAGGSITFVTPLVGGKSVVIVRNIEISRTTAFPTAGPFNINSLNVQLAKLIAIQQQLNNDIERVLRLADSDTTESFDIPAAALRANKFLGFDADGDPFVAVAVTDQPATAFMLTLLDDATAAAARATLGLGSTDDVTHGGVTSTQHDGEVLNDERYQANALGRRTSSSVRAGTRRRAAIPSCRRPTFLGNVRFDGSNGTSFEVAANIAALSTERRALPPTCRGRWLFSTSAEASATPTERMAIRANGKIQIPNRSAPLIQFDGSGYADLSEISAPTDAGCERGAGLLRRRRTPAYTSERGETASAL